MERLINNMKNKSLFLVLGIFLLFSLTFVAAQPPFQQSSTTGLQIEYQKFEYFQIGEPFEINAHVYNQTGYPLTNETVTCYFHAYAMNGTHVIDTVMSFDEENNDFYYMIPGELFTGGKASWTLSCNDSSTGGFVSAPAFITRTGFELTTSEALIYSVLALGVLLLFLISFYFLISTPYQNEVNEKGAVIKITKLKYVKLGLILLSWVLFTWFLNILIGLADSFVSLTMYYGFFGFIFDVMNRLSLPLGIVVLVIALFEIVRDANIYGNIKKFGSAYK